MSDPTGDEPQTITPADIDGLNQRALLRTLDVARRASNVTLAVAALLALGWVWTVLRSQGVIGNTGDDSFGPLFVGAGLGAKQRVDFLASTLSSLGMAALVAGVGLGIRLYGDVATLRAGGSLTGWDVGDPVDPIDLDPT